MPATPKKGRRFGGDSAHQRLMMANLVASLIAAEVITTTEAKAKALRPIAEKVITKAKKGGLHNHRQVVSYLNDKEIAAKLF
ncbi:MAG: ribosomal protein, partial [Acidimicrobiales bacterium]|nr:ribosomal protein [Acidimicrobiales bacterium]